MGAVLREIAKQVFFVVGRRGRFLVSFFVRQVGFVTVSLGVEWREGVGRIGMVFFYFVFLSPSKMKESRLGCSR